MDKNSVYPIWTSVSSVPLAYHKNCLKRQSLGLDFPVEKEEIMHNLRKTSGQGRKLRFLLASSLGRGEVYEEGTHQCFLAVSAQDVSDKLFSLFRLLRLSADEDHLNQFKHHKDRKKEEFIVFGSA